MFLCQPVLYAEDYPLETVVQTGHFDTVYARISPNGRYMATIDAAIVDDKTKALKLWEIATGKELRSFASYIGSVTSVDFSPDNRYIVIGDSDSTKLFEITMEKEIRTFDGHSPVHFSSDGQYVFASSQRGIVKLFSISGIEIRTFKGHSETISSMDVIDLLK